MLIKLEHGFLPEWAKKPNAIAISIGEINIYEIRMCYAGVSTWRYVKQL
jgi:hypothetical protein